MNNDKDYLIWSNEHNAWWGPYERGYVKELSKAGHYSRERAILLCKQALGTAIHIKVFAELPIRYDDVMEFIDNSFLPEGLV